ncbi:serine protease inhibitor ecotin [Paraherbaspirillum soli]|uniref:Serine protease inhibitor ecotin n=1 Tax=Paraherbaspirillum soli TaxID=631222 RepID=A0ABW0MBW3_9BURK
MKKMICTLLAAPFAIAMSGCGAVPTSQQTNEDGAQPALKPLAQIAPYPAAAAGQTRWVIRLPQEADEKALQLELVAGKTMDVDCNRQWFSADMKAETLAGWGYTYHVLQDVKGPASTLMACRGQPKKPGFVPVSGAGYLLRYNSKLPVVAYLPEGFTLQYRIWRAGDNVTAKEE